MTHETSSNTVGWPFLGTKWQDAWLFLWSRWTPQEEATRYRNFNLVHSRTWAELLALRLVGLMHGAYWHLFVI